VFVLVQMDAFCFPSPCVLRNLLLFVGKCFHVSLCFVLAGACFCCCFLVVSWGPSVLAAVPVCFTRFFRGVKHIGRAFVLFPQLAFVRLV